MGKDDDLKKNRRDRDRKDRHKETRREKDRSTRPSERVNRSDCEKREYDYEREKLRTRRDRKISDSDEERRDTRRGKEKDDIKRDLKRTRKEIERTIRHGDENGENNSMEEEEEVEDEKVEKRRRRLQEWQQLQRKHKESQSESKGPETRKAWTLEGESDDEDNKSDSEVKMVDSASGGARPEDEEEIDPLDAYMNSKVLPEVEKLRSSSLDSNKDVKESGDQPKNSFSKSLCRIIQGEDSDSDYDYSEPMNDDDDPNLDEDDEEFMKRVKKTKTEKLSLVDHSKVEYEPFRKNFYIEVKDISRMTYDAVNAYRKEMELKVHGKDVPRPIRSWYQTGLTTKILDTLKKLNYEKPMPIQAQALPIIMSGRDCIGVAKTGSGKTLGFVLPMLRHIKDQPPVEDGDGPIGLVMAPTRELVQQIHSDIKKFAKALGLRCVAVYGGSGVAQQINKLKRGTEIVVCTPGRMIDILCTSSGKITNLRRVTFLVMDEADRMFDMGFEPQITCIVQNIRPDHQTVLFSATFPRQVETLARKVLNNPVEIQVGGRRVVNKDITQLVEIRPESERFTRLRELLLEWYEKGKVLVFVRSQDKCDALCDEMENHDYACLSLHGGMEQRHRESAISGFKNNFCSLLIATSVAARGLDVKELVLVVNFDPPNHYEEYVHRVGRTGRAGRKGCAITFISEDDANYAPDLVKALELSEQPVPDAVKALADGFMMKVKQGIVQAHGTGYGGSGFKFNKEEEEVRKAATKARAKIAQAKYGYEEEKSDSEDENDVVRKAGSDISQQQAMFSQMAAIAAAEATVTANQFMPNGGGLVTVAGVPPSDLAGRVAAMAAAANLQHNLARIQADVMPQHYEAELEINDFPQNARWRVTHKETLGPVSEWSGAAITVRGQHYNPGSMPGPGQRKLYLFVEGATENSVKTAKSELKRVLEDVTNQAFCLPGGTQARRYSVL
ncbi:PREDICTED: DEAD-box ATP-dependent RNA helicase 42-like [Camelina sativa]|uniref:RNA helicase n=1 Tax=Camelina sativa TaxID=90675 RepID=A0ABM0WQF6_CAMSA|nr:PREDICTED: DEAD-box ATP-dependent RNA helicase 42-like [Camelina sativa]